MLVLAAQAQYAKLTVGGRKLGTDGLHTVWLRCAGMWESQLCLRGGYALALDDRPGPCVAPAAAAKRQVKTNPPHTSAPSPCPARNASAGCCSMLIAARPFAASARPGPTPARPAHAMRRPAVRCPLPVARCPLACSSGVGAERAWNGRNGEHSAGRPASFHARQSNVIRPARIWPCRPSLQIAVPVAP